jgi:two-component system, NarL family, nitrate/nitrite response regulator NarL
MITLLIIDDHPLVSDGISTMLKGVDHVQVAGACKTAGEALDFLSVQTPDIILLDISLPDINGIELCASIRKQNKTSRIIGLTSANETGLITQLLSRGANGYLLKNMEREELITAINQVMSGKIYLSREANDKLLEQFSSVTDAVEKTPVMTRREKEIIQLLYEGLTGPQIAEKLFLSPYTVETHRKNLLQKFNVNTSLQLLKMAKENRLI